MNLNRLQTWRPILLSIHDDGLNLEMRTIPEIEILLFINSAAGGKKNAVQNLAVLFQLEYINNMRIRSG